MDYRKELEKREQELRIFIAQANIRIGEIQGQIKLLRQLIKEEDEKNDKKRKN